MTKRNKPKRAKRNAQPQRVAALSEQASAEQRYAAALRASAARHENPPEDQDVFRLALARRMFTLMRLPLRCGEPACRRSKTCVGPTMRCRRDVPPPPMTQQQSEEAMAAFKRALRDALLRQGMEPPCFIANAR